MSELQFQDVIKTTVQAAVEFTRLRAPMGRLTETIPMLLNATDAKGKPIPGEVPRDLMDFYGLLDERVNGKHEEDRDLLRHNYVVVGDSVVGDPDGSGEIIIATYKNPVLRELVRSINPDSELVNYSLRLSGGKEQYEALKEGAHKVLSASVAGELRSDLYSHKEVREQIYDMLSRGDKSLVRSNLDLVAEATGRESSEVSLDNAMGLYPADIQGLRPLWVWTVGGSDSLVSGHNGLDIDDARPVGVAPEALDEKFFVPRAASITTPLESTTDAIMSRLAGKIPPDFLDAYRDQIVAGLRESVYREE